MHIVLKSINRWHAVQPSPLSEREVLKQLFTERGIETDFAVTQTDLHAFEQTRFKVFGNRKEILVAVAPACIADNFGAGDSIEIFFDPFHDHIGYCQFYFDGAGSVHRFTHLPYPENHSSAFPMPRLLSYRWTKRSTVDVVGAGAAVPVLLARFDRASVFQRGNRCGFNVVRFSKPLKEPSAWNRYSGHFFQDATGFGNLYGSKSPVELIVTKAELKGDRLELTGPLPTHGFTSLKLLDPLGNQQDIEVGARGKTWRGHARINPRLFGRYRIHAKAGWYDTEPEFLFFDLAPSKPQRFAVGLMYDIPDDLRAGFYTPRRLERQMAQIRACGVTRLYWIDYPDYPDFPSFWDSCAVTRHALDTFKACGGDLLKTAARASKRQGMEFIGVFKPFDLGFSFSTPGKRSEALRRGLTKDIDQRWLVVMPEIAAHPEWTVQANPAWQKRTRFPVTRIRLYSEEAMARVSKGRFTLWTSKDNKRFTRYGGPLSLKQGTVQRPHHRWTPAGKQPEPGARQNWYIELAGLQIDDPYLAIEAKVAAVGLKHRRFMAVEVTDSRGNEAPVTLGGGDLKKGLTFHAKWSWAVFTEENLDEFTWNSGLLGMVFAERERVSTLLEPSFKGARRLWLGQVKRMLMRGVDGIDIRTLCHHNTCDSWLTYAFAEPVREAFRERHGREVRPTTADHEEVRRIRGEFYSEFIREASRLTRSHGKKFSVHLEPGIEVPSCYDTRMQMVIEWEKWIAEGLLDEITLKYWGSQSAFIHEHVLPRARKAGIAVYPCDRNSSLHTPRAVELAEHLVREACVAGLSGFTFYEVCSYFHLNAEGVSWPIGNADHALRLSSKQR